MAHRTQFKAPEIVSTLLVCLFHHLSSSHFFLSTISYNYSPFVCRLSYSKSSHVQKGKSYVALKWSKYLKDSAQTWAEECARTGVFDHAWHLNIGENMAKHTSSSGTNRPPTNILTRWVENEMYDGYPGNGHMTQALWRSTHYVGCGEARKGNTYYQVCQYSKPGNCSVNSNNFWVSVLADDTGCKGMPLLY